jgi:short-subunit dehydrogenase
MDEASAAGKKAGPRAVVTGASSGIGRAFAERLARDGYDLVLVARRQDRLESLAASLGPRESVSVEAFPADLTDPGELRALEERIAGDAAIDLLVNNAGFGGYAPFAELDPDRAEELIRLQVTAVTRLTRAALPGMIARGHGAIVNVSSRLAFSAALPSPPLPKRAVYAATKAYVNAFSRILADEVASTGVRIQALCPGVVLTEFHTVQGIDPTKFPVGIMSPEDVVSASLAGLARNEVICIPALDDPELLAQVEAGRKRLWDESGGGAVSKRYGIAAGG